jgi:hypothetical protein
MSFDLGPIKRPIIQESQNMQNNGGGGNLGYMSQGENEEEAEKNKDENTHLLESNDDVDVVDFSVKDSEFESDDETTFNFKPSDLINKITGKIFKNKKPTKSNPFA